MGKKVLQYLIPIFVMLALFYITACVIECTFDLSQMRETFRQTLFLVWLGFSLAWIIVKAFIEYLDGK